MFTSKFTARHIVIYRSDFPPVAARCTGKPVEGVPYCVPLKLTFLEVFMKLRQAALLVLIAASVLAIHARAQQPSSTAAPGARSPYVTADNRPQGWATKDYLQNTLGWP